MSKERLSMDTSLARKKILDRIRNSLTQKNEMPYPPEDCAGSLFVDSREPLVAKFRIAFTKLEGRVELCHSSEELLIKLRGLIERRKFVNVTCQTTSLVESFQLDKLSMVNKDRESEADASITDCEFLVARTGAVVLSARQPSGRIMPVHTPAHIVIANQGQLVCDTGDAIDRMKGKYPGCLPSAVFFASGPSRTGDIERTLVVGVHGPREVYVFLVSESSGQPDAVRNPSRV